MNLPFADKVVWITGGGTGLGRAMALEFAGQGAKVAVSGRRQDRLDEVVLAIESMGGSALAVPCDVTDEVAVSDAVAAVLARYYKLDVVVANAGFAVAGKITNLRAADWRRQFDVNVVGLANTVRASIAELKETEGRVALVGSVAGQIAAPGTGAYSASKYAVRAIGQTLAVELHGSGVSVTLLQPGFVESEIAQVDNKGRFDEARNDLRPAKLMWPADRAARDMVNAIYHRRRDVIITGHGKVFGWLGRHLPGLAHFVFTRGGTPYRRNDEQA
ncbi:MAG: NADP-dependent 3-hydroxy acid dehydrogenase YdfG [Bradymonadia bacterium]|jgi:NADP-dependent 3-hydroxy acid dehydrogenase YdfG